MCAKANKKTSKKLFQKAVTDTELNWLFAKALTYHLLASFP